MMQLERDLVWSFFFWWNTGFYHRLTLLLSKVFQRTVLEFTKPPNLSFPSFRHYGMTNSTHTHANTSHCSFILLFITKEGKFLNSPLKLPLVTWIALLITLYIPYGVIPKAGTKLVVTLFLDVIKWCVRDIFG